MARAITGLRRKFHRVVGDASETTFSLELDFDLTTQLGVQITEKRTYFRHTINASRNWVAVLSYDLEKAGLDLDNTGEVDDEDNVLIQNHNYSTTLTTSGGQDVMNEGPQIIRPPEGAALIAAQNLLSLVEFDVVPPVTTVLLIEYYYRYVQLSREEFLSLFALGRLRSL